MTNLKVISREDNVRTDMIAALEDALELARAGKLEGYALVVLAGEVHSHGAFDDRLRMLGALKMAEKQVAGTSEPL